MPEKASPWAARVEVVLTEPMLGTVPFDKKVYETFIENKKFEHAAKTGTVSQEALEEKEAELVEQREVTGWTGFRRDKGLLLVDYMIRGHLKESGNVLKNVMGLKAVKSKVDQFLYVFPRHIHILGPDGNVKVEPDGVVERPLRASTAQGPRVTLVRSDQVGAGCILKFRLFCVDGSALSKNTIRRILEHGELTGYGQFRNGSYGRFEVKVFEEIEADLDAVRKGTAKDVKKSEEAPVTA